MLGRLPRRLIVFGIEGSKFDLGTRALAPPVAARVDESPSSLLGGPIQKLLSVDST